jgi:small subunit ribosomal protein S11
VISRTSCGLEGFKNCRKGTNVAAQSTAMTMAKRARELGATQVRVKIRGFGPGRAAAIKGFELGGLDIVSISDITFINWLNNPRPRKRKRL